MCTNTSECPVDSSCVGPVGDKVCQPSSSWCINHPTDCSYSNGLPQVPICPTQ